MRIGDAAAASGLTPRALRYYEQRGLITARRTPSGHRDYGQHDIERLRAIRELLDAGLTIGDVRAFAHVLDTRSPSDDENAGTAGEDGPGYCPVADVTTQRVAELNQRIERLTRARDRLTAALAHRFGELFRNPAGRPDTGADALLGREQPIQ
ncbi:MerR family transcriptional regulator [Streptomyces pinistramenti]|uniref:MerR family transcriptional regulator n=1 Tax=Streptomyces pinistramenti TaxID=2884812 RepID=UPI001D07F763|nr:MerR family transcriptional regulator [Streptomyces pinistramenti]MCB5906123.1 MerR family transcriptional regulator [Streptomyces pinistramenti]